VRRASALLVVGILALVLQGVLATFVAPPLCPDLGLLVVLAIGLRWRGLASGFAIAAVLGYVADLLSGSLFGLHALLRLLAFATALLAARQLNLRGALPLAIFAAAVTAAYGLAALALTGFFTGAPVIDLSWQSRLAIHALINALFAAPLSSLVGVVYGAVGDEETRRGSRPVARRTPA